MNPLDTNHVIASELGKWYSVDGKVAFLVLDEKRKTTTVSINFEKAGEVITEVVRSGSVKAGADKQSGNREVHMRARAKDTDAISLKADRDEEMFDIQNQSVKKDNNITRTAATKRSIEETISAADESPVPLADDNSIHITSSARHSNKATSSKERNRNSDGALISFVKSNPVVFGVFDILTLIVAMLITLLCFLFPKTFTNVNQGVVDLKNWAKPKLNAGINLGISMPNLAITKLKILAGAKAAGKCTVPFGWIWCFVSCIGKCLGLSLPGIPKWMTCIINCFKDK